MNAKNFSILSMLDEFEFWWEKVTSTLKMA